MFKWIADRIKAHWNDPKNRTTSTGPGNEARLCCRSMGRCEIGRETFGAPPMPPCKPPKQVDRPIPPENREVHDFGW